jgi:hypothetical protein
VASLKESITNLNDICLHEGEWPSKRRIGKYLKRQLNHPSADYINADQVAIALKPLAHLRLLMGRGSW